MASLLRYWADWRKVENGSVGAKGIFQFPDLCTAQLDHCYMYIETNQFHVLRKNSVSVYMENGKRE